MQTVLSTLCSNSRTKPVSQPEHQPKNSSKSSAAFVKFSISDYRDKFISSFAPAMVYCAGRGWPEHTTGEATLKKYFQFKSMHFLIHHVCRRQGGLIDKCNQVLVLSVSLLSLQQNWKENWFAGHLNGVLWDAHFQWNDRTFRVDVPGDKHANTHQNKL